MHPRASDPITELPELHGLARVFRDRTHAGEVLSGMLEAWRETGAIVLAVPCGGVPVAAELARRLGRPFEAAPVAKVTPGWDREIGYGAVAWDGTERVSEAARAALAIGDEDEARDLERARAKVAAEVAELRGGRPFPDVRHAPVILVDDGVASGLTLEVAVEALKKAGAKCILLAAPTAHSEALRRLGPLVHAVYCPNVRSGGRFAVADAYQAWTEVTLEEARKGL